MNPTRATDIREYAAAVRRNQMLPTDMADAAQAGPAGPPGLRQKWVGAVRRRVPDEAVALGNVLLGAVVAPMSRRKAAKAVAAGDVRLNLGCGHHHLDGWVNVDLSLMHADLLWDLRRPLPFPSQTVSAVFLEHVLEHLPLWDGLELLDQVRGLLRPGGVLRIGVPDFGRYARSYAGDGEFLDALRPGRRTPMLALAEVAYCYGHLSLWDIDTLRAVLDDLGFARVEEFAFGESSLTPAPDQEKHRGETVYVEASVL